MSTTELVELVNGIQEKWKDFFKSFSSRIEKEEIELSFDDSVVGYSWSINQLDSEIESAVTLLLGANFSPAILRPLIETLNSDLQALSDAISSLVDGARFTGSIDVGNLTISGPQGTQNIASLLAGVEKRSSTLIRNRLPLILSVQPNSSVDLLAATAEYVDEYKKLKNKSGSITRQHNQSVEKLTEIRSFTKQATALNEKISQTLSKSEEILADIEVKKTAVSSLKDEAVSFVEGMKEAVEEATELSQSVTEYSTDFDKFQTEIDERFVKLAKLNDDLINLQDLNSKQSAKIKDLNNSAEAMLSGATTAGLAGEFSSYRDTLGKSLFWASASFYASIILLGLFSLPLTVMVVPSLGAILEWLIGLPAGLLTNLAPTSGKTDMELILDATARVVLILPFVWLTTFAARRHGRLFRLKEHYAYKRSIAASVDGFKLQAPEYSNEIAAAAFHELAYNPADRMDKGSDDGKVPNPVWTWLMKRIESTRDKQ